MAARLSGLKKRASMLLALGMFATVLSPVQLAAQSQNEVLTTVLYDGTQFDADSADDGAGAHTPGLDASAQNNVVKTHDTFAARVDWNVNEDAATDVFLTVVIPPFATWAPDATGMFAGCDPALSSFPDDQTLICSLGDQIEGSNGAIRPIAQLNESTDGTTFDIVSTLTTGEDAAGVSDGLDTPLIVSEAPIADWLKDEPEVVQTSSGDGYVFLYPLTLVDFSQGPSPILGAGPISNAAPIDFFDHAYGMVPSATIATPAQMADAGFAGRSSCGAYDGTGPYPIVAATWTCGPATTGAGYPVVPISISGFTTTPAPALNADGTPNVAGAGMQALTGQIALFLPLADVNDKIALPNNPAVGAANFDNAIAQQDESAPIATPEDIVPIDIPGTNGPVPERGTFGDDPEDPADNIARAVIGDAPVGDSPGATIGHDIRFYAGPLQVLETYRYDDGATPRHSADLRTLTQGGLFFLPGAANVHADTASGDLIGETPRGATLTINSQVLTAATAAGNTYDAPIQGCTAFDTTHYNLTAFGDIPVTQTEPFAGLNTFAVAGGYTTQSNAGPLAHVYTGSANSMWPAGRGQHNAVGGFKTDLGFTVEFTDAPLQLVGTAFGVNDDELTCLDSDAGPSGWVDATDAAALAVFDTAAPGDGIYEGITRARVRITDRFVWLRNSTDDTFTGFQAFFQAAVKTDLAVQTVNQELFALQSHSFGDLGADGLPDLVPFVGSASLGHCAPYVRSQWELNGNLRETSTGFCNNTFIDDGADSLDDSEGVDWDNRSLTRNTVSTAGVVSDLNASGTVVSIVEAALGIAKSNNAGLGDIKDNGQLVEFTISPRVVGSGLEALTNVRLTDALPANYEFVQFLSQPATGPGCTEAGGTITCQFSEPNPAVDSDPTLPAGLAGGWSDEFQIQVEVVGAIADPDSPVVITNTATVRSSGLGPWDPAGEAFVGDVQTATKSASNSANSFLPLPADQGAIVKAVDGLLGPCDTAPSTDPGVDLAEWAARCSLIQPGDDMSFILSLENEGNTAFSDIEIIDVFPWNGDGPGSEPPSETTTAPANGIEDGSPATIGDGRTPPSAFTGDVEFVSVTPVSNATGLVTYVTGDAPATVSRDPLLSFTQGTNTWCDAAGGAVVNGGTGACPASDADVTASYTLIPGDLNPAETLEIQLTLSTVGVVCEEVWTNTFGARVDQILLPIRSNDVSIMTTQCFEAEIDIEKDTNGVQSDVAPGEEIVIGAPVTWTYVVENTGTTALADATVSDSPAPAGGISCDIDGDGVFDGTAVIPLMLPGDQVTCEATGVATGGPFTNNASVSGDPIVPDFSENPDADPSDPSTWPTDPAAYQTPAGPDGLPLTSVDDEDPSNYTGVALEGEIDIEKDTNGVQSDEAPGEEIAAGSLVTWTYEVTNTGETGLANATVSDVPAPVGGISCDVDGDGVLDGTNVIPFLAVGASVTCEATGLAQPGPFTNNSSVTGDPVTPDFSDPAIDPTDPTTWPTDPAAYTPAVDVDGVAQGPVDDEDPSNYFGTVPEPGIDIEKDTNGVQSDEAPGEDIVAGSLVTWTYEVTNSGGTGLANATVSDVPAPVGGISCDVDGDGVLDGTNVIPFLAVGASVTCEATGLAQPGPFTNNSSVTGDPVTPDFSDPAIDPTDPTTWPTDPAAYTPAVDVDGVAQGPVDDEDPSNYFGTVPEPGIDIEKDTNGVQSDEAPGEPIPAGAPVTWTYVVTNTGATALADVTVTDSQGVVVSCDIDGDGVFDGTNVIAFLPAGGSVTCEGTGVAVDGPYENVGDVSGNPIVPDFATCGCDPLDPATWPTDAAAYVAAVGADGEPQGPVDDADASHYTGLVPGAAIDIEKATNGVDSDEAPGETINLGAPVTWTYVVINTGSVALTEATVTDSQGVVVSCDIDGDGVFDGTNIIPLMTPGASVTCEGTGVAIDGPYENVADVTGAPALPDFATCGCDPNDPATWPTDAASYDAAVDENGAPLGPVSDADASNYTGFTPVYDLALEKTLAEGQATTGLAIGDAVTFTIEVFNQGNVDAADVEVIDYLPEGLELNDPTWADQGDGTATATIEGVIAAGASASIDITMTITAAGDLSNIAEITGSTAVDANGEPFLDPAGDPLVDVDSIADAINTDVLSDGVLNGDDGDEDDHDIASITIEPAPAAPEPIPAAPVLAFTGRSSLIAAGFALLLLLLGTFMVVTIRTREEEAMG